MLTFAYYRVSTEGQTTDNQALELEAAGYLADQVYQETISGKVPAAERPEFARMFEAISRTVPPKRLIVTKLDRLGRNAADVLTTVERLAKCSCTVHVLQLGNLDLTSPAGKIVLATLAALAEFERELLIERTQAGLKRARAAGVKVGRRPVADAAKLEQIKHDLGRGLNLSSVARLHEVSRATVWRINEGTYKGMANASA